ncbi:hypothetical protein HPB50_020829 [Hyalomma asiaticum]|uniref:Uncharacterized protein n=1 Tax=Hyalomma asiaticum TaxID=266040 RepID=A0ACB7T0Q9_HYAAI|nr:hypothetical protein HPB50_020829 [Hyalomma asiaticum]
MSTCNSTTTLSTHPHSQPLRLSLSSTFDNVSHSAILAELAALNPGTRSYDYIRAFLTARTAEINIGDHSSPTHELGPSWQRSGRCIVAFSI